MRRNAVFFLLLVSACGAAPPAALTRCVGTYEWFSTFGTGRLDLGEDGCYRLTLQNPQHDAPRELVGNWRMAACNWGEQDRGGMVARKPSGQIRCPASRPAPRSWLRSRRVTRITSVLMA
jgi:hypothetical protein